MVMHHFPQPGKGSQQKWFILHPIWKSETEFQDPAVWYLSLPGGHLRHLPTIWLEGHSQALGVVRKEEGGGGICREACLLVGGHGLLLWVPVQTVCTPFPGLSKDKLAATWNPPIHLWHGRAARPPRGQGVLWRWRCQMWRNWTSTLVTTTGRCCF